MIFLGNIRFKFWRNTSNFERVNKSIAWTLMINMYLFDRPGKGYEKQILSRRRDVQYNSISPVR